MPGGGSASLQTPQPTRQWAIAVLLRGLLVQIPSLGVHIGFFKWSADTGVFIPCFMFALREWGMGLLPPELTPGAVYLKCSN